MRRLWSLFVSMRTTAILLVVVAVLLLLNVLVPQAGAEPERFAAAARSGRVAHFALVTLGLGRLSTSPPFLLTLSLLFVSLAVVLLDRVGTTLRRVRFAPPSEAQAAALLESAEPIAAAGALEPARAVALLARVGYRAVPVGGGIVWGVKHRLALLGFPLFHASFFFMLAGGLQLFLTRHVITLVGAEGEPLDSRAGGVVRSAPLGPPPPVGLVMERIEVRLVDGKPVDLAARIAVNGEAPRLSRINHPATWGPLTVLVERAGIAPVLWLTDARGYTLDRVAAPTAAPDGRATRLKIGPAGDVEVAVRPIPVAAGFPERETLGTSAVSIRVESGGAKVFDGPLRPGEPVAVGDRTLRIQEIRYYGGLRLVSERGGGLLILGFVLSVVGIVWRMMWFRREVVVRCGNEVMTVAGRCEFFPARFRDELAAVAGVLAADAAPGRKGSAA